MPQRRREYLRAQAAASYRCQMGSDSHHLGHMAALNLKVNGPSEPAQKAEALVVKEQGTKTSEATLF